MDAKKSQRRPKSVVLPLWIGVNWPWQRHYPLDRYLRYFDPALAAAVQDPTKYQQELQDNDVQFQVLNALVRLKDVRAVFTVPLTLKTTDDDAFEMWIEPKTPTVHGPTVTMAKQDDGHVLLRWRWSIRPLHWAGSVDAFLRDSGFSFDRLDSSNAERKTHEESSGHVHKVLNASYTESSLFSPADYWIRFSGSFHIHGNQDIGLHPNTALVSYSGHIDTDHLAIHSGVKVLLLEMSLLEKDGVSYKIL